MLIEPLSTIEGIQSAIKQDPKLRYDPLLSKKYLGLGGTLSNNAIPLPAETKEPLAIFSRDGKATVEEAKNKVAGFVPPEKPEAEKTEKPVVETKGGLTFDEAIQLFGQDFTGLQQQMDGTYIPDKTALERLGVKSEKTKEDTALEQSKAELENIKTQISKLMIPDEEVQRQISNISAQWDERANEMKEINRSREAALMTTGLRLGSQYTGGLRGGVFGSIISEEERQGVSRIQDLEAKKQEAILAAKKAQRENNYTVLVKQADLLEKSYNKQLDEIKELNKLQADKAKELREKDKEARDKIKSLQEINRKKVEGLGSTILNRLTGDEATDVSIIKGFADAYDLDANFLLNEILKQDQEKTKKELLTREIGGSLYEYNHEKKKWELAIKGKSQVGGAGETGEVSRDVESVMNGTLNLQDISVKDNYRAVVAGALTKKFQEARKSGDIEGMMRSSAVYDKEPSDTFLQSMEKTISVLGQLGILQESLFADKAEGLDATGKREMISTGPIVGTFRSKNPWDTKAQTIKAQLNAIVPNLARGVYGEVGVLTDNDIKVYSKTIPNLSSTKDIINAVLYITVDLIRRNIENKIKNQAAGQRDMSGFAETYKDVQEQADEILMQITGANKKSIKIKNVKTGEIDDYFGDLTPEEAKQAGYEIIK